ncbi:hypothetical protein [Clostridium sp. Marseille-P2415]|uniref:hypothetical protein n=1 Tax=Clostridium sp. Marseille-P2415 TaxID=1805471 RepID=UPI0009885DCF|nr:hypothetical protein [Clostridium sp. Marseille-P2415]
MKKTFKRTSAFLLASMMCVTMAGTAFAYSPSVTVGISPSGSSLKFSAQVKTDAPANYVDNIYLSTESINEDTGSVLSAWDGSKSGKNSLASGYTLKNPIATAYSKWAYGEINYISAVPDDGFSDTVSTYYQNKRSANKSLIAKRDNSIADSFDIDLSGYEILNPPDKEYFAKGLLQTRKQANVQAGDTVPVTYINEDGSQAYVIKQDAYGTNYMFEFENSGDDWTLISSDQVKGKVMEPTNQADALSQRNEAESEVEIDISSSEFLGE